MTTLEDVFAIADLLRLILPPDFVGAILTSIRLRLVSRSIHASIIAAGYPPGYAVDDFNETLDGKVYARRRSWTQVPNYIRAAFYIGVIPRDFFHVSFWKERIATNVHYDAVGICDYQTSEPFFHFKDKTLSVKESLCGRLFDAIVEALKNPAHGKAFIQFLLSPAWKDENCKGFHYLALEYALDNDDPSLISDHFGHFTASDLKEVIRLAVPLGCKHILYWFMEHPYTVLLRPSEMERDILDIFRSHIVSGNMHLGSPVFADFVAHCAAKHMQQPAQGIKRKADEELSREACEVKRICLAKQ